MRDRLLALLLVALVAACGDENEKKDPENRQSETPDMGAVMRRGIGLLESFRYKEARDEFRRVVQARPDWIEAKINYAIALMNLTSDEKGEEDLIGTAISIMREVVAAEPKNPQARFMLGFLLLHSRGEATEALKQFAEIAEPDGTTRCWMGRARYELGDYEGALREYERAIELDRHLSMPHYGRFVCLSRLGRKDEANAAKRKFVQVRTPQQANLLTAKAYHEIGYHALAVRHYPEKPAPALEFEFTRVPESGLAGFALEGERAGIGVGDVDGDGDPDVYLPGVLYENRGKLEFVERRRFPATPGLFLDYDNDKVLDLFLYGERDRLYRGSGDGTFAETTAAAGFGETARNSRFALAADLDMDGDVDLFVTEDGAPDRLLSNNRDGTFTETPLGGSTASRGAIPYDFDRDQDPDLIVAVEKGPPIRFRNDRADGFARIGPAPLTEGHGLVAGDLDRDGFEEVQCVRAPLLLFDVDLDGTLDRVPLPRARCASAADFDADGVLEVVSIGSDGKAALDKPKLESKGHWIAFDLRGRTAPAPPQWAAPVGPGSRVEVLAGELWQLRVARSVSGFGGQHAPWVHFGLGEKQRADIVRIVWPDRVLQAELDVPADQVKLIREVNRKPSSCPMLFAVGPDGTRFLTDFLGSGGLGFFLERGVYGKPDPDEVVAIGELEPVGGEYRLQVLEPLEEISYLDEATLLAVDHPKSMEVFANERFAGEEPFPEFRIWEIDERIAPVRAFNDRGQDVTAEVAGVDRRYPPIRLDGRFEGFARPHWLALDFTGRVPTTAEGERLILLLDGWVEYGYSHSNYAAAQAGLALDPPRLELRDGDRWRTAIANTGYPAGLPRTMTLDVTGVVTAKHPVFRLRTNLEIYWDRVTLGVDRGGAKARIRRVVPTSAHLHERGYPREYSPDGALPLLYDYGLIDPGYPFKTMSGDYTRFGEVAPLLAEADDCFVIFGKGEELTLRYAADHLPRLQEGMRRTFFLYTVGFCKDMDPYTAHPYTVEPLPFRAMSNYPYPETERYPDDEKHRRYRAEWNTRRVAAK